MDRYFDYHFRANPLEVKVMCGDGQQHLKKKVQKKRTQARLHEMLKDVCQKSQKAKKAKIAKKA